MFKKNTKSIFLIVLILLILLLFGYISFKKSKENFQVVEGKKEIHTNQLGSTESPPSHLSHLNIKSLYRSTIDVIINKLNMMFAQDLIKTKVGKNSSFNNEEPFITKRLLLYILGISKSLTNMNPKHYNYIKSYIDTDNYMKQYSNAIDNYLLKMSQCYATNGKHQCNIDIYKEFNKDVDKNMTPPPLTHTSIDRLYISRYIFILLKQINLRNDINNLIKHTLSMGKKVKEFYNLYLPYIPAKSGEIMEMGLLNFYRSLGDRNHYINQLGEMPDGEIYSIIKNNMIDLENLYILQRSNTTRLNSLLPIDHVKINNSLLKQDEHKLVGLNSRPEGIDLLNSINKIITYPKHAWLFIPPVFHSDIITVHIINYIYKYIRLTDGKTERERERKTKRDIEMERDGGRQSLDVNFIGLNVIEMKGSAYLYKKYIERMQNDNNRDFSEKYDTMTAEFITKIEDKIPILLNKIVQIYKKGGRADEIQPHMKSLDEYTGMLIKINHYFLKVTVVKAFYFYTLQDNHSLLETKMYEAIDIVNKSLEINLPGFKELSKYNVLSDLFIPSMLALIEKVVKNNMVVTLEIIKTHSTLLTYFKNIFDKIKKLTVDFLEGKTTIPQIDDEFISTNMAILNPPPPPPPTTTPPTTELPPPTFQETLSPTFKSTPTTELPPPTFQEILSPTFKSTPAPIFKSTLEQENPLNQLDLPQIGP